MNREDRVRLVTKAFEVLLSEATERAFVVIENVDDPDEFAQFQLHDGTVYGEVGSREWNKPHRPVGDDAVIELGRLNFRGGGPEHNYCCDGLPTMARTLANLVEKVFAAAYGVRRNRDYVLCTNSQAVEQWLREAGIWFRELPRQDKLQPGPLSLGIVRDYTVSMTEAA
jgi:hypothetical protein